MAQDLPDDVWNEVAETQSSNRRALHNMSLTNRRMHRLVVPVLFRSISFEGGYHEEAEYLMASLIRNILRARFLFNCSKLLRHTRFFTFWEEPNAIAEYLTLQEGSDSSSSRRDAENLVAVLHDEVFRLIFRMPRLRRLHLRDGVMTPLSYAAISSRPLLTSLSLKPRLNPNVTHLTRKLPYTPRLLDFDYYCDPWVGGDRPTDPYLVDILDHSILDLERLTMDCILLPLVVSRIPLHRTLSLRSLTVGFHADLSGLAAAAFFQVLRACPQLRLLEIDALHPTFEPTHYLPPPSFPNLSTLSGTSFLLQMLSGGTNLVKISIDDIFYLKEQAVTQTPHEPLTFDTLYLKEQSLTQVIRSSPSHLREFFMGQIIVSQTPHGFLTFIRSLTLFRNLEKLDIFYELDISWKEHVSAEDSHSTIKDLLNQLACLRFLNINSDTFHHVEGYDIGCPISKEGEPADRGHPSLEGIYVDFICGMWSWDSRKGWMMSNWAEL